MKFSIIVILAELSIVVIFLNQGQSLFFYILNSLFIEKVQDPTFPLRSINFFMRGDQFPTKYLTQFFLY